MRKKKKSKKQKHPQLLLDNSRNVRVGQGSGEAGGTGKGGEGADWEAVIGGVGEGEQKEKEEEDPQQIGGEDSESVRVLQSCADGRETHVVTEGVAKYRTNQVACSDEDEGCVGSKHCRVGKLKHCREENTQQSALSEPQQLNHMVEVSHSEKEGAGYDSGRRTSTGHQHGQHACSEHQLLS